MGADLTPLPAPEARGARFTPAARDAALELVRRTNRWMIAGAVAASGVLSLVAANAFHGRTIRAASPAAAPSSGSGSAVVQAPAPSNPADGTGLQAPAEPPVAAPSGSIPQVASGGS